VHIHRIGRTGRAGGKGIACSLFTERESAKIARIEEMRGSKVVPEALPQVNYLDKPTFKPPMACLQIDGGKKQKIRPGDIVGALTGADGIAGTDVGKIHVFDNTAYVAVRNDVVADALRKLSEGQLKGRNFRVRRIRG
jgi:ATP-independent RNA helicase DbpA